jgi:GNAT superfamily N-acetyltransferase
MMWHEYVAGLSTFRGGSALLEQLPVSIDDVIADVLQIRRNDDLVGFCLVRHNTIEALYVIPAARRQGCARAALQGAILNGAVDALALPGDRATKSLYESATWRARLLTMRQA